MLCLLALQTVSQSVHLCVKLIGNRMYRMLELPPLRQRIQYLPSCSIDYRFTLILSHRHEYTRQATSVGFPIQILFALLIFPTRDIYHDLLYTNSPLSWRKCRFASFCLHLFLPPSQPPPFKVIVFSQEISFFPYCNKPYPAAMQNGR